MLFNINNWSVIFVIWVGLIAYNMCLSFIQISAIWKLKRSRLMKKSAKAHNLNVGFKIWAIRVSMPVFIISPGVQTHQGWKRCRLRSQIRLLGGNLIPPPLPPRDLHESHKWPILDQQLRISRKVTSSNSCKVKFLTSPEILDLAWPCYAALLLCAYFGADGHFVLLIV